ncbi:MAG: ABC transporter permease [Epulopiscium sp.]|nr:ABC transporter permease [Candidatus Epulonipiscium sp.]
MSPSSFFGAISQGLLWSVLAMGVYITYRILDFADLTTEGSFPLGAAVAAKYILSGYNPIAATFIAMGYGLLAGLITGFLNTKLKIPGLLSGILVMTGLYSINLRIMGKANLPLLKQPTVLTFFSDMGMTNTRAAMILGIITAVVVILLLWALFSTELGFAIRATGNNPHMIRALGVNTDFMTMLGLMLSNALISLAGALIAQYNGFADVGMGTGTIVIGLASVIIGEVLFGRTTVVRSLFSVVCGSILYRLIIAAALERRGFQPTDLKLLSSIVLAVCLSLPLVKEKYNRIVNRKNKVKESSQEPSLTKDDTLLKGGNPSC